MSKLYDVNQHPKEALKRDKAGSWRRGAGSKGGRRFYSQLDMSIIKHDIAVRNSQVNRGEIKDKPNGYISHCGCGAVGCFVHGSFDTVEREFYR